MADTERIVVSEDGLSIPAIEVLTGRGAIFGKSGSGKSNTASVVIEELLETGFPVLIVDIEGEYATLQERYEVVHVGDGDAYDYDLFETNPDRIVDFCLDQHRPVIMDLSDVIELERAEVMIRDTLQMLFSREKQANKPFLVIVEEVHEFLPQRGGLDDLGEMLIRIAKRGRKRGLGLLGMSQRPASVDKNFITQCDWLVFHRLTWENDTRVVKSILGSDYAEDVKELRTGSAFLMADWEDAVREVKFRRKRTADAGVTPSLAASERRDLTNLGGGTRSTGSEGSTTGEERVTSRPNEPGDDLDQSDGPGRSDQTESAASTGEPDEPAQADRSEIEAGRSANPQSREDRRGAAGPTNAIEGTTSTILPEERPITGAEGAARTQTSVSATAVVQPLEESGEDSSAENGDSEVPARRTLWELGQFVTFFLVRGVNTVSYWLRVALARLTGHSRPVDRISSTAVDGSESRPAPTRFALRILLGLLSLIIILVFIALLRL
ncbi:MAG: ATP-binding protein [Halodesulfurarchaeum sp.]